MPKTTSLAPLGRFSAGCPRCRGRLIAGPADSEASCVNCGHLAYASGLTIAEANAELANRPSLPVAPAGDARRRTRSD